MSSRAHGELIESTRERTGEPHEGERDGPPDVHHLPALVGNRNFIAALAEGRTERSSRQSNDDLTFDAQIRALSARWAAKPLISEVPRLRLAIIAALDAHPHHRLLTPQQKHQIAADLLLKWAERHPPQTPAPAPPRSRPSPREHGPVPHGPTPDDSPTQQKSYVVEGDLALEEIVRAWARNPRARDLDRLRRSVEALVDLHPDLRILNADPAQKLRVVSAAVQHILTQAPPITDEGGGAVDDGRFPAATLTVVGQDADVAGTVRLKPLETPVERKAFLAALAELAARAPKPPPRFVGELAQGFRDLADYLRAVATTTRLVDPALAEELTDLAKTRLPAFVKSLESLQGLSPRARAVAIARDGQLLTTHLRRATNTTDAAVVALVMSLLGLPDVPIPEKERIDASLAAHVTSLHDVLRQLPGRFAELALVKGV